MNKRAVLIVGSLGVAALYFLFVKSASAAARPSPIPQPQQLPGGIQIEEITPQPQTSGGGILDLSWITDIFKSPEPTIDSGGPTEALPTYYTNWQTFSDLDPLNPDDILPTPDPVTDPWTGEPLYPIIQDDSSYNVEDYAVMDPEQNLSAFLAMIRTFEAGTSGPRSYSTLIGGGQFSDFSEHPFIVNPDLGAIQSGDLPASKAAGAYQFLPQTWIEAKTALGLPDFSPASQDAAAVFLINRRGALNDVRNGNFASAIVKLGREWASLPGSPYGQTSITLQQAQNVYENNGGIVA